MSAFIQEKPRHMFALFDVDGNGVVTADDFRERADRIVEQFPDADPQKVQAVRRQYADLWQELAEAADADGDGKVTESEFTAVLESASPQAAAATIGRHMAEFTLADTNGDGHLDRREIVPLLKGYGVQASRVDTVMSVLDKDGDGRISGDEYAAMLRDVYVGTEPSAPGVDLFGRLSDV
ncbi:EF-hand domain-containing protein [Embleya sp. NPDC008237]|uniref:EF-hand domain-containing protein n=1 Tax=Embleya sp. NPDC008237 TaxID=3363978 RepID=UPI0036EB67AB